ncbi:hypothetical protein ACI65C_003983 [Semiaphis heraclei]
MGLDRQLPYNHPLIQMLKKTLEISHRQNSPAASNYTSNVSRPRRDRPDEATTINYLKNLRLLFNNVLRSYIYEDQSFPKGFDLLPCVHTVTKIKLLEHKLGLVYKRTTKQQPTELFARKTLEGENLPDYGKVAESIMRISDTIPTNIELSEKKFSNHGTVNIKSEKSSSPEQKQVSYSVARYTRVDNLNQFSIFQLSNLWRKVTCGLAINILWTSKQMSGVAVNMTVHEWENHKTHECSSVVTVTEHKTGDKEPATVDLNEEMTDLMDR